MADSAAPRYRATRWAQFKALMRIHVQETKRNRGDVAREILYPCLLLSVLAAMAPVMILQRTFVD